MLRAVASASLLATGGAMQLSKFCANLNGQWENMQGNVVTVRQSECDVEVSGVFDQTDGQVTHAGVVGGNSLHVKEFSKVGRVNLKDHTVEFADGAMWRRLNYDPEEPALEGNRFLEVSADEAEESRLVVEADTEVQQIVKSCNWDCYLKRYPGLENKEWEAEHPKKGLEYAKLHFIKYGHASGRNCQCDADMLAVKMVQHAEDAAEVQAQLAEQTELLAQAAAEAELIKDCDFNCYLERYPKLRNEKWESEKGNVDYARSHYLQFGRTAGKNCKCQGPKNLITGASLLQLPEEGSQILVANEAQESQVAASAEMTITEMCKSCNWDCYLKRFPALKNKQWEAEHPQKGLEYAKLHYIKFGRAAGRSCQCDADMLAAKLVEQPWDAARLQGQLAEQTEVLAEAAAEVELIKGCNWNCYVERYPKLRNEKWEQEKGNQDYARSHYLKFGRAAGKNCKCGKGPKNLITGASLLGYQPGSVNCADINGEYKNKLGKVVTVKQTNCDVEVSSVWDEADGEVTKSGHVGGNSVHVKDFEKIGTIMGKDIEFADGALWAKTGQEGKQMSNSRRLLSMKQKEALDDAQESQMTTQAEMTITEMVKSCNWDCYLRRYPGLKNKQWEAQHPQKKFEYVKMQYLKYGRAAGRNCQCDADMLADKFVEQPWDAVRLQAQLAEQTEVLAEAAAEVELIKGCDWNCYLDRYPMLRNEKWEKEWKHQEGNQDYARSHYLRFGRAAGKNCKCEGGK